METPRHPAEEPRHVTRQVMDRLGLHLTRNDESYVSYLKGGHLNIAPPDELDEHDTIEQILTHELCHWLVEGPDAFDEDDWGLTNFGDASLPAEYAAIRLQLKLASEYDLEHELTPTTEHRWLYEELRRVIVSPEHALTVSVSTRDPAKEAAARASTAIAADAAARMGKHRAADPLRRLLRSLAGVRPAD